MRLKVLGKERLFRLYMKLSLPRCSILRLKIEQSWIVQTMSSISILGEVNNAIKREQNRTCSSYAECEHFRRSQ